MDPERIAKNRLFKPIPGLGRRKIWTALGLAILICGSYMGFLLMPELPHPSGDSVEPPGPKTALCVFAALLAFTPIRNPRRLVRELLIHNAPLRHTLRRANFYNWRNFFLFCGVGLYAYGAGLDWSARAASKGTFVSLRLADKFYDRIMLFGACAVSVAMVFILLFASFGTRGGPRRAYSDDWRAAFITPAQVLVGVVYAPFFSGALALGMMFILTAARIPFGYPPWWRLLLPAGAFGAAILGFTVVASVRANVGLYKICSLWLLPIWLGACATLYRDFFGVNGSPFDLPNFLEPWIPVLAFAGFCFDFRRLGRLMALGPDSSDRPRRRRLWLKRGT